MSCPIDWEVLGEKKPLRVENERLRVIEDQTPSDTLDKLTNKFNSHSQTFTKY